MIMRLLIALSILFSYQLTIAQENTEIAWGSLERTIGDYSFRNSLNDSMTTSGNLIEVEKEGLYTFLNPAFDLLYGVSKKNNIQYGLGFDWHLKYRKWTASATFLGKKGNYLPYQEDFVRSHRVLPAMGVTNGLTNTYANYKSANLNFKANDIFSFEMGYGRNFIGHGHRSLFLSDFGNASPYFKVQTTFWNLQYTNLFAAYDNIFNVEGASEHYQKKYTATHFLEWNIKKWISIGLFETVIWEGKQGNYRRGYDVNYLNPVIFYRPIEFSTGSPDNVLVGAQLAFKPSKYHQLYSQLVFDEFLLDELRADVKQFMHPNQDIKSGWWANKYGVQLGWKATSLFKDPRFFTQLEYNLVRPFTYSHSNPTQAYSNYNLPLAHPLGANFHELVSKLSYTKDRWRFTTQFNYSFKGHSKAGTNFGENLEYSTISREKEYENHIGQGTYNDRVKYVNASVAYLIKKEWKANINLSYVYRESQHTAGAAEQMVYLGLRTNLFKQHFDF